MRVHMDRNPGGPVFQIGIGKVAETEGFELRP